MPISKQCGKTMQKKFVNATCINFLWRGQNMCPVTDFFPDYTSGRLYIRWPRGPSFTRLYFQWLRKSDFPNCGFGLVGNFFFRITAVDNLWFRCDISPVAGELFLPICNSSGFGTMPFKSMVFHINILLWFLRIMGPVAGVYNFQIMIPGARGKIFRFFTL